MLFSISVQFKSMELLLILQCTCIWCTEVGSYRTVTELSSLYPPREPANDTEPEVPLKMMHVSSCAVWDEPRDVVILCYLEDMENLQNILYQNSDFSWAWILTFWMRKTIHLKNWSPGDALAGLPTATLSWMFIENQLICLLDGNPWLRFFTMAENHNPLSY